MMIMINALRALAKKFEAEKLAAETNLSVYMNSPSGIGEHPDIVAAVEDIIKTYNDAKELLESTQELIKKYEEDRSTGVYLT